MVSSNLDYVVDLAINTFQILSS